jgi:excisionase family DNA binding protein
MRTFLTADEVAERVRLSKRQVHRLARQGILPGRQLHRRGRLLFDPDEVERAIRPLVATREEPRQPELAG